MARKYFSLFILLISLLSFHASALVFKSYNIRNFSSPESTNLDLLTKILQQNRAHIISVMEIKNTALFKEYVESEFKAFNYKVILSKCGGAGNQRLGFIYDSSRFKLQSFTEDLSVTGTSPSCNRSSRPAAIAIFNDLETKDTIGAIAVHLKAGGCSDCVDKRFYQLKQLSIILQKLELAGIHKTLVMGDFNTTNYNNDKSPYKKKFEGFVAAHKMKDSATQMKCSAYWGGNNRDDGLEEPSLLDHILISDRYLKDFSQAKVSIALHCKQQACKQAPKNNMGAPYEQVSDHCPIGLHLR